jgi:hypothetical protein
LAKEVGETKIDNIFQVVVALPIIGLNHYYGSKLLLDYAVDLIAPASDHPVYGGILCL